MTHCTHCSADNLESAKFCASCGGRMEAAVAPVAVAAPAYAAMRGMAPVPASQAEEHYPSMRGMAPAPVLVPEGPHAAMRGMDEAGVATMAAPAGGRFVTGKTPMVAIALSFLFPGGGQFYNGDMKKGLAVFGLTVLASCLTIYAGAWILGVPLSLGTWVWAMMDAGKVARGQKATW